MEVAEKVRFWEEQQRINAVLIPRVVDGARTLERMSRQLGETSDRLRALDLHVEHSVRGEMTDHLRSTADQLQQLEIRLMRLERACRRDRWLALFLITALFLFTVIVLAMVVAAAVLGPSA